VLYLAADLLWATRIKGTADQLGVPCRPVRNAEMLRARLADTPVAALIADLEAPAWRELIPIAAAAGVQVLAFAPHVAVEAMNGAAGLGAKAVMARGAFSRLLPELLPRLVRREAVSSVLHD
jgi:hypothetical protein